MNKEKLYEEIRLNEDVFVPEGLPEGAVMMTPPNGVRMEKDTILRMPKNGKVVFLTKAGTYQIPYKDLSKVYWDYAIAADHTIIDSTNNKIDWDKVKTFDDFRLLASTLNFSSVNVKSTDNYYDTIKHLLTIDNNYNEVKTDEVQEAPKQYYKIDSNKIKTTEDVIALLKALELKFDTTDPNIQSISHLLFSEEEKAQESIVQSESHSEVGIISGPLTLTGMSEEELKSKQE